MNPSVSYPTPAGLLDRNVEFFATSPFKVRAIHNGRVYTFDELPEKIHQTVTRKRLSDKNAEYSFNKLGIGDNAERDERYAYCLFGALDNTADLDTRNNTLCGEYRVCSDKHSCPYAIRFCTRKINTPTGESLAPREIELVQLIAQGYTYKEICQRMLIAEGTLVTYRSHVFYKLEAHKQSDVTRFALLHNLL
jgi:DNA-binding CsgD family transcriptional regulator